LSKVTAFGDTFHVPVILSSQKFLRGMMQLDLRTGSFKLTLVARILIAATLTLAILSSIAPPGLTSSRHFCTMACCAGKPLHEAGSCQANLSLRKPTPPKEQEELCETHNPQMGQHGSMHMQDAPAPSDEESSSLVHLHQQLIDSLAQEEQSKQNSSQQTTSIAASMLTRPCPPDCGAGTFSSSSQSRPRDSAAVAYADRPRPPSSLRLSHPSDNPAKELADLFRRSRPRGPPLSFS
jgi:hypothetical protein